MWKEAKSDGGDAEPSRLMAEDGEKPMMTAMNAVEVPNGERRPSGEFRNAFADAEKGRRHAFLTPFATNGGGSSSI